MSGGLPRAPLRVVGRCLLDDANFVIAERADGTNIDWLRQLADGFNQAATLLDGESVVVKAKSIQSVIAAADALGFDGPGLDELRAAIGWKKVGP